MQILLSLLSLSACYALTISTTSTRSVSSTISTQSTPTTTKSTSSSTLTSSTSKSSSVTAAAVVTAAAAATTSIPTSAGGYTYKGCYVDSSTRILGTGVSFNGTVEGCISVCKASSYAYAGVEYGSECYCGNSLSATIAPNGNSECNMVCSSNSLEYCGASWRLEVYAAANAATIATTSSTTRTSSTSSTSSTLTTSTRSTTSTTSTKATTSATPTSTSSSASTSKTSTTSTSSIKTTSSSSTKTTPTSTLPVGAVTGLKYVSVGGSGSYAQVTNMKPGVWPSCTESATACQTATVSVSGNLAPFNDELSLVFRGPMNIYNIAVYQPPSTSYTTEAWNLVSSWTANSAASNLVFLNNMGGSQSGMWSICGGSSQSYATADWTSSATSANPGLSTGYLDGSDEINIMTSSTCTTANPCPGFSRGVAYHGWANSKMFVVQMDMPINGTDVPAMWLLNAQVMRSAQFGCNCRGMGGNGGCGELDLLEVLSSSTANQAISEIYSFKGATGSGANFFVRPTTPSTYVIILDVNSDSITVQQISSFAFGASSVVYSAISGWMSSTGNLQIPF